MQVHGKSRALELEWAATASYTCTLTASDQQGSWAGMCLLPVAIHCSYLDSFCSACYATSTWIPFLLVRQTDTPPGSAERLNSLSHRELVQSRDTLSRVLRKQEGEVSRKRLECVVNGKLGTSEAQASGPASFARPVPPRDLLASPAF